MPCATAYTLRDFAISYSSSVSIFSSCSRIAATASFVALVPRGDGEAIVLRCQAAVHMVVLLSCIHRRGGQSLAQFHGVLVRLGRASRRACADHAVLIDVIANLSNVASALIIAHILGPVAPRLVATSLLGRKEEKTEGGNRARCGGLTGYRE
eukprot:COSAG02_NODE_3413_length_6785_cov_8.990278_8_plen_153_part_00